VQAAEEGTEDEPSARPGQGQDDKSLQKKLMESLVEANKWRSAFKEVAGLVGFSTAAAREPDIQGVLEAVQRLKMQGQAMQVGMCMHAWHCAHRECHAWGMCL
jgi:hypothetical protein